MICHHASKTPERPNGENKQTDPPVQTAAKDERAAEAARKQEDIKNSTVGGF